MNSSERAMTDLEVADRLQVKRSTLRAWRCYGKGPRFVRVGRLVRYLPGDVDHYVRRNLVDTVAVLPSDIPPFSVGKAVAS